MAGTCDICRKPVLPGEGRFGAKGDGGRSGSRFGDERHYACHLETYGAPRGWSAPDPRPDPRPEPARAPVERAPPAQAVRAPKVRKGEYNRSANVVREFRVLRTTSEMGRSRAELECPFCFLRFWAFIWSLAGGGKKCPNCGAMHASGGHAYPVTGNEDL